MNKLLPTIMGLILLVSGIVIGLTIRLSSQPAQAQAGCRTFTETNKAVCGRFLEYWNTHGGLAQQGLPLSGEFTEVSDLNGQSYTVQYFERAVFEKHPENAPPWDVLLSQLGMAQFKIKYPSGDPSGGAPPPPPAPSEQAISFSGTTTQKTTAFHLSAGNYTVTWSGQDTTGYGCYLGISLRSVDPNLRVFELIANKAVNDNAIESGTTQAYNIKNGDYYFDVNTGCKWSVSIKK
jgi:hypothetical protein